MHVTITFQPLDSLAPEVLRFWREQQALQDPWKGLTGSPEWFAMMASGSVKPAVVAVARGEDGGMVAVIPLLFQSMAIGKKHVIVARVHGGDMLVSGAHYTPHPNPLPQGERVQIVAVWGAIVAHDPEVEAIVLDHVDESRVARVRESCGRGFFWHARSRLMPHYRMILPPTYEEFRKLRSASSMKKIEGRERAMAREAGGECRLVEIRQPADWAPYAAEINRLMNTTWQAVRLGHGFDIESCRPIAERGWLRSFLLLAGTRPAAFVLGYQGSGFAAAVAGCQVAKLLSESPKDPALSSSTTEQRAKGAVFHYEQIGHDAGLAKYSPGTILLYRLIQRLYEKETPGCVDFGEGEAEYKKTLANEITYAQSVMVVRNRLRWRVHFGVLRVVRMAREKAKIIAEKWGLRKRIAKYMKYR